MKRKEFKEIIELMVEHFQTLDKAYSLKIDLFEAFDSQQKVVNLLWKQVLTPEGEEWLCWFLYEKNYIKDGIGKANITANDEGTPICEDLDGLYDYLNKNNYFILHA